LCLLGSAQLVPEDLRGSSRFGGLETWVSAALRAIRTINRPTQ
jgi:hypothetical protein